MNKAGGKKIGDLLREAGVADSPAIERALKYQHKTGERLASSLLFLGLGSEKDLVEQLGVQKGVPAVELGNSALELSVVSMIPYSVARQQNMIPLRVDGGSLLLAMADPDDSKTIGEVEFVTGMSVIPHVVLAGQLRRCLDSARSKAEAKGSRVTGMWIGERLREKGGEALQPFLSIIEPGSELAQDLAGPLDETSEAVEKEKAGAGADHDPTIERPAVLIVDDDPDILEMVAKYMEHKGLSVDRASNGTVALEKLKAKRPGVLVLDAMLPGVHGFEICRKVKESKRYSSLPVIMISAVYKGWRYREDVRRTYKADEYIEKPFPLEKLYGKVRDYLEQTPARERDDEKAMVEEAEAALKQGLEAQGRGDVDEAVRMFRKGIAVDPMSHRLYFHLANVLAAKEAYFEAIDALEKAIELSPDFFPALKGLAVLYQRKGLLRKSAEMWERALYVAPDNDMREKIRAHLFKML